MPAGMEMLPLIVGLPETPSTVDIAEAEIVEPADEK